MKNSSVILKKNRELQEVTKCFLTFSLVFAALIYCAHLIQSPTGFFIFMLISGWLSWTFMEYMLHRFWMHNHFKNVNSKTYIMHMDHHKNPTEIKITGMQRFMLVLLGFLLIGLALLWNNYFTLFVGFYIGFVLYTLIHIMLHQKWGRYICPRVQKAHIHHHGKYPDKGYSFSIIIWDWIFGTLPPRDAEISDQMVNFYFKNHEHSESKPNRWLI